MLSMGNFPISEIHLSPFNGKVVGCFFSRRLPLYVELKIFGSESMLLKILIEGV